MSICKIFLLFFLIISINTQKLVNPDQVCKFLKKSIFKTIKIYKNMKESKRNELFKYSLRKLSIEILNIARFQSNQDTLELNHILFESRKQLDWFEQYKSQDFDSLHSKQEKAKKRMEKAANQGFNKQLDLKKVKIEFDRNRVELRNLRYKLEQSTFKNT